MNKLLILSFILLMQGCIPQSVNPLTEPERDKLDTTLLGTWYWHDDNEAGYIHIGLDKKTGLLRLVMADTGSDGVLDVSEFVGHTSKLMGGKYLNIRYDYPKDDVIAGYLLVKYIVLPHSLGIALMDREAAESAIETGELQGEVRRGGPELIRITATPEALGKFVIHHNRELFPELKYLSRLELPKKNP